MDSATVFVGRDFEDPEVDKEVLIIKEWDTSSVKLHYLVVTGAQRFVELVFLNQKKSPFMEVKLERVIMTSYRIRQNEANSKSREEIKLNFAKIEYKNTGLAPPDTGDDTMYKYKWERAAK